MSCSISVFDSCQVTCPAVASWMTTRLSPALETPPGELWYCVLCSPMQHPTMSYDLKYHHRVSSSSQLALPAMSSELLLKPRQPWASHARSGLIQPPASYFDIMMLFYLLLLIFDDVLSAFLQRSVGHWDWSADNYICWSHRWCHESLSGARHQAVCLWSLRCLGQALGHQRRNVPTDLHWPRVGHQRYLRKATHTHTLRCYILIVSECQVTQGMTKTSLSEQVWFR